MYIYMYLSSYKTVKMGLAPYENFRGFASSRPPLIVFMICLGLFAIVLMTLGYYVQVQRNPDVSQVSQAGY